LALRNQKPALLFIQSNGQAVSRQFFQTAINDALNLCGQCVKIIYQKTQSTNGSKLSIIKTQSTNVSNLSTRRHSQPMCQIYLPKDTVKSCTFDKLFECVLGIFNMVDWPIVIYFLLVKH
jgi:hypothetical protein